jgi:hypothetical protein
MRSSRKLSVPEGETSEIRRSPILVWSRSSVTTARSTSIERPIAAVPLAVPRSGTEKPVPSTVADSMFASVRGGVDQVSARRTAAVASTMPKPAEVLVRRPPPLAKPAAALLFQGPPPSA